MHIIGPLISGIAGAEAGSAQLFVRGTSTRATWYDDFEGTGANSSGADLALDSFGGAEVYVNQLVDVVVKNITGTTARSFTAGDAVSGSEARSQSFTGVDYQTALSAAGSPTTLQAVLDLWKTNNGAIDWKVLIGASSLTVRSAIMSALFFNVKDPTYGATGDGTTDDTAAVQAAVTAAVVVGGVVWFPAGTYRTTASITVASGATLMGVGPASQIRIDHATAHALTLTGGAAAVRLRGLLVLPLQSNSGSMLACNGADSNVLVEDCVLGAGTLTTGDVVIINGGSGVRLELRACFVLQSGTTGKYVTDGGTGAYVVLHGCTMHTPPSYSGTMLYLPNATLTACRFEFTATTVGTFTCMDLPAGGGAINGAVLGCSFTSTGGAAATVFAVGNTDGTTNSWEETGNRFGATGLTVYSFTPSTTSASSHLRWSSRDKRHFTVTDNTASYAVPAKEYGVVTLKRDAAGGQALTFGAAAYAPAGAKFSLHIHNDTGAGIAFTVSGDLTGGSGFTIAANSIATRLYERVVYNTTARWVLHLATGDLAE